MFFNNVFVLFTNDERPAAPNSSRTKLQAGFSQNHPGICVQI